MPRNILVNTCSCKCIPKCAYILTYRGCTANYTTRGWSEDNHYK